MFGKIFGSELLFLGVGVGLVLFDGVLPRFLLYNLVSRSRKCPTKILLMSGLPFWGRSTRQPYCHTSVAVLPPFRRGNAVHFFCFSVASSVSLALFAVFLFWGSLLGVNFRERTFVFGCRGWICVFRWCFAQVFVSGFGTSLPKLFGKNSLNVRSSVFGFVLSFLVFRRRRFCFF